MDTVEFRYSTKGVIRVGDIFRARGGPVYKDQRVGSPGVYRMLGREDQGTKVYILAVPVDKYGIPVGGTSLLYVQGRNYRLPELPDWIIRPYKISKKRMKR